jgi:hypothetical protein
MYTQYPDSPEAVALELWNRIREAEGNPPAERGRNVPRRADLLALYSQCLTVVRGADDGPSSGYLN